jgi:hypothetical protein
MRTFGISFFIDCAPTMFQVSHVRWDPVEHRGHVQQKESIMATTIIRYTNRYAFEIVGNVDVNSDKVEVKDYARVESDKLYFVLSKKSSYSYRHELGIQTIGKEDYQRCLLHCYGPEIFNASVHMDQLLKTGHCVLNQNNYEVEVYVGMHFAKFFGEAGKDSLAKCYAFIAQKRKEHADSLDQVKKLLAVGANANSVEETAENLVEDIKWFLDNRTEIKAKCK